MKGRIFPLFQYIEYFLKKVDEHSLHSPFAFRVYLDLKRYYSKNLNPFNAIEQLRAELLKDQKKLTIRDYGAGSRHFSSTERKVSDIVRFSSSSQKHALLYQFFCSLTPAQTVVELGTGLGLNTFYLAATTLGKLFTFEGAEALLNRTRENFLAYDNIQIIPGDITKTLPEFLETTQSIDFALLDANHTYDYTISYFNQMMEYTHPSSILVIGDIHWSKEMQRAWLE